MIQNYFIFLTMSNKFIKACKNGRVKYVKSYIKKNGYDANKRLTDWIERGIYEAIVFSNSLDIIKFFIENYENQTDKNFIFRISYVRDRQDIMRYLAETGYEWFDVSDSFPKLFKLEISANKKNLEYEFVKYYVYKLKVFMNYDKFNKYLKMEIVKQKFLNFTEYELVKIIEK